jgi:NAD(P)-dependent dehydrogenase (short-subunit alcohol dehydrogenase family)
MSKRLAGKVCIVTGATSGIGWATACVMAEAGAKVVAAGRRTDRGEVLMEAIRSQDGDAIFVRTDVDQGSEIEALVAKTVEHYGRLDCAFNNAGILGEAEKTIVEQSEESWHDVIRTNLTSVWLSMKYEIPAMLESRGGSIVNNSSIYGLTGSLTGLSPYVAAKHGVTGLTRTVAVEYGRQNIRINAVCPGFVHSEITDPAIENLGQEKFERLLLNHVPMGRVADAKEIAYGVSWLCSDEASYVTGETFTMDGGWLAK